MTVRCPVGESWTVVALALAMALVSGCAQPRAPAPKPGEDAFDVVHFASYASVDPASRRDETLPRSSHAGRWFPWFRHRPRPAPLPPRDKVHPELRQAIASLPSTTIGTLMVTFKDPVTIPRFPAPPRRLERRTGGVSPPPDSAAVDSLFQDSLVLMDSLILGRAGHYTADSLFLVDTLGTQVLEKYWLLQAMLVRMPLGSVDSLALRANVVSVRFDRGNAPPSVPPPVDGPHPNVSVGRAMIHSDHYRANLGLGNVWMAILDTGVRTTHVLLCDPKGGGPLCMVVDCLTGDCDPDPAGYVFCNSFVDCTTADGGDLDPQGHGTGTAAVLTGIPPTSDWEEFRGLTSASLDCFRVYDPVELRARASATQKAFQLAVLRGNRVIAAEIQETSEGDVTVAAENAYAAGAVVIAANGNEETWAAGQPARSPRVIGVGAVYAVDRSAPTDKSAGVVDGVIKPDLLAPSYTETAKQNSTNSNETLGLFSATSGATPYAAGAAALMRDWMTLGTMGNDPGHVYAHLLVAGDRVGPFGEGAAPGPSDQFGAGLIQLPATGTTQWGKTWFSEDVEYVDVPIEIPVGAVARIEAAIWWPAEALDQNGFPVSVPSDLDLEIRESGLFDMTRGSSKSPLGVFERARVQGDPQITGQWYLRITAKSLQISPQTIYWAVSLLPDALPAP